LAFLIWVGCILLMFMLLTFDILMGLWR